MSTQKTMVMALIGMLLVSCGCSPEPQGGTPQTPAINEPAPIETKAAEQPVAVEMQQQVAEEPNAPPDVEPKPMPEELASGKEAKPPPATEQISASKLCDKCTDFLGNYVNQHGLVDYRILLRKKIELLNLLDVFKTLDRNEYNSWSKEDKLALWINAYNLQFIRIILDNYPIESNRMLRLFWPPNSIRHIKGIWDEHKFIIMEEEFTLKEIDERFFENEFGEPRVFFAINYGSLSGPPLRNEAYRGQKLSSQLDNQVKKFLDSGHALRIERDKQRVYMSPILKPTWYGQQFLAAYNTDLKFKQQSPEVRAVLNFLINYIPASDVSFLETGNYSVEYMGYDWTLNDSSGQ